MRGKLQEGGPNSNQDELIDSFVRELFGPEVKLDYIDKDGVSSRFGGPSFKSSSGTQNLQQKHRTL
jgi:hypothetical protein